jgi:glycosyltransferase involved in cell wall biosynthesis
MTNTTANIAALVPYQVYPPKMGGQKGIAFFYRYLGELLPVTIITTKNNVPEAGSKHVLIPALSNSRSRYINPLLFFKLRSILKKNRITHLILEHPYYGWLGVLLKWFAGVKLVIHSHNIEANRFKSMGKWWWGILWNYEKFTHKRANMNFFIQDDDREFAIRRFGLDPAKCMVITYGFEMEKAPSAEERAAAREILCKTYAIDPAEKILLFNGTLDYKPNREALDLILEKINLVLSAKQDFKYRIIICGNKLPASYNNLSAYTGQHITYAGFVDDINLFFKGADIFINPVIEGGGIKTKVVEALGHDLSVISTRSGATGIAPELTARKLQLIDDGDWNGFVQSIISMPAGNSIPKSFFDHFYWANIAKKAASALQSK